MFLLMNKNDIIASYELRNGEFGSFLELYGCDETRLPYGCESINYWLKNRKAVSHNEHIRRLICDMGCDDNIGFIQLTHAGSLNDTFWMKSEDESVCWEDVSYYQNEFSEVVSKLAFEGQGLSGEDISGTKPELSTEGSFPKCWKRENGEITLIKSGSETGTEPYCEAMAAEIAGKIADSVTYRLDEYAGKPVTKCTLFTDEKTGYIYASKVKVPREINELMNWMSERGFEDSFRRMLLADCLTFNPDRHAGNYGFLMDNSTLKITGLAPAFDYNLAMLPYADNAAKVPRELNETWPKIGDDFVRFGQMLLTEQLRKELNDLRGYEFTFRGDEHFPETRVKLAEELFNRQLEAILSKEVLYTKDIFS